ncbi:hypothetical protein DN402_01340 [Streptomyces sp. SW4]|nr:hypothetical protein DN402_01340 [Streptomyces sp. SW4]
MMGNTTYIRLKGSIQCTDKGLAMTLDGPSNAEVKVSLETQRGWVEGWWMKPVTIPERRAWQGLALIDRRWCDSSIYELVLTPA